MEIEIPFDKNKNEVKFYCALSPNEKSVRGYIMDIDNGADAGVNTFIEEKTYDGYKISRGTKTTEFSNITNPYIANKLIEYGIENYIAYKRELISNTNLSSWVSDIKECFENFEKLLTPEMKLLISLSE